MKFVHAGNTNRPGSSAFFMLTEIKRVGRGRQATPSLSTAAPEPKSSDCQREIVQTVPGLVLVFLEAVILASIAVAISTRLPMLPNLLICATIYIVGHMVPLLLNSALGRFAIVGFVSNLIAAVLPVLGHLSVETAISTGRVVPMEYLGVAVLYTSLYCLVAMILALLLFEDRDLASLAMDIHSDVQCH